MRIELGPDRGAMQVVAHDGTLVLVLTDLPARCVMPVAGAGLVDVRVPLSAEAAGRLRAALADARGLPVDEQLSALVGAEP